MNETLYREREQEEIVGSLRLATFVLILFGLAALTVLAWAALALWRGYGFAS